MQAAQRNSDLKFAKLTEEQTVEREKLKEWVSKFLVKVKWASFLELSKAKAKADQEIMQAKYDKLAEQTRLQAEENKRKQEEMIKIIEKKNYESHYPIPQAIKDHQKEFPYSFNIQVKVCSARCRNFSLETFSAQL